MSRDFQIIIWGATGFTGRLVARYMCQKYGIGKDVCWTIAGRNGNKLQQLRTELESIDPKAGDLPLIVADSHDAALLRTMAARADVVLTTVGPYSAYGADLVAACVEERTDYVDLCGETPFIRRMIDTHHEAAQKQQCRIVHCCGFDSIPSDIGVLYLQQEAEKQLGAMLPNVSFYVEKSRGSMSGGTVASMLNVMDQARDPAVRKVIGNPYGLNPYDGYRGPDTGDQQGVKWDKVASTWTAPFVMAGINTRVVRRSNALLNYAWGTDFAYREVMAMKKGFSGWWKGQQLTIGLALFVGLAWPKLTRKLLTSTVLPAPGEGPSPDAQESGFFRIRLIGTGDAGRIEVVVRGKRDPGYGATSRMLAESALCLALERDSLPNRFGILTPASGIGTIHIKRLKNADIIFKVEKTTASRS